MDTPHIALSPRRRDAILEPYAGDPPRTRTAVLIFPGGGYQTHTDWECKRMARFFSDHGFAAFVVRYSVGPDADFPELLRQASQAVWHVRRHADGYGVMPERIVACGFSAGAHLVTMLATHWHEGYCTEGTDIPTGGNRPDATVTGYTPTTFEDFEARSGLDPDCDDGPGHLLSHAHGFDTLADLTTHTRVDRRTPPAFLWKTTADFPPGTLEYAAALDRQRIPYEVHVFTDPQRCASAAAWSDAGFAGNTRLWATLAIGWLGQVLDADNDDTITTSKGAQ